jgi:hypothetical protein
MEARVKIYAFNFEPAVVKDEEYGLLGCNAMSF